MLNRLLRYGLAAVLISAVAGYGVAYAQDGEGEGEENPCGANPCGEDGGNPCGEEGMPNPCGEGGGDTGGGDTAGDGATAGGPSMLTRKGVIEIGVSVEVGLDDGNSGDPVSLSPDVRYGVSDKLDVGVIHSGYGVTGFVGAQTGASLCITGDFICESLDIYHNIGVEGRFALKDEMPLGIAAVGGLHVLDFDPFQLGLKAGLHGQYMVNDKIGIMFDPSVIIVLTERNDNDALNIPVMFMYAVSPKLFAGVQTGLLSTFSNFGDNMRVPLTVGAHMMVNQQLGAGAGFTLPAVVNGIDGLGAFDLRTLSIWASYNVGN